jgi:hypothetical protein
MSYISTITSFDTNEVQEAKARLLELLEKASNKTIYTIVTKVAPSGMSRWLKLYIVADSQPINITREAAAIFGAPYSYEYGLKVRGAGMDMGFHVVYSLSYELYKDGYKIPHKWL